MYKNKIQELAIADNFADSQIENLTGSTNQLLKLLIEIYGQKDLAVHLSGLGLDINRETLNKWKKDNSKNHIRIDMPSQELIRSKLLPSKPVEDKAFKFIDLFAGIGGLRQGFSKIGGDCVFTSEWDDYARRTYLANHYVHDDDLPYFLDSKEDNPEKNNSFMDIQEITLSNEENVTDEQIKDSINKHIPYHDVLLAGFPCQPFSLAGVSKKNSLGRSHGFDCETQGTLFFDVEKVIEVKQPKFFVLENVKNLKNHDKGNTFAVIIRALDKLGYWVADISDEGNDIETAIASVRKRKKDPVVIDGQNFVPQHRERIILVGVRRDIDPEDFSLTKIANQYPENKPTLKDILTPKVDDKYTLTDNLWNYLFNYAIKHQKKGNGFGFGLVNPENENAVCRTLSARYYKDGSEILLNTQGMEDDYLSKAKEDPETLFNKQYKKPRRLTPRECARLMGFEKPKHLMIDADKEFVIPVSDTRAYKQFGNSVVVPVFQAVAELMKPMILKSKIKGKADVS
jgi:DNA (cytosine-5)-methyltransferase 1